MADDVTFSEPLLGGEAAALSEKTMRVQQLFVKHQLGLRAFILSLEPNFTDAEDLLQEVFLVITRKANEFQEGTNFFAWGCTIARFKLMELLRRRAKSQALSEEVIEALCAVEPEHQFEQEQPECQPADAAYHNAAPVKQRPDHQARRERDGRRVGVDGEPVGQPSERERSRLVRTLPAHQAG